MCKRKRNILQFSYDIEECIDVIQEEISKVSFEEFVNDRKTIGYTERQLEKIGEAISQIQKLDKNILTDIKGMRNRLIHEYWGTSLEMIYEVSVFEMEDLLKYIYLLREKLKY